MATIQERKAALYDLLRIEDKEERIRQIERDMQEPDFWADSQKAGALSREAADLQKIVDEWLAAETDDQLTALETKALLSGPYDHLPAIVSFSAGAGGTEAQDWANMLMRMYSRWAERRGYAVDLIHLSPGEEAGVKSATLRISGLMAYGYLKGEHGVHRLVRLSPFDADRARHTSFALVEVVPELAAPVVELTSDDLKIETFRSSGHGGQNVQKVETAVRVTHLPTGLSASSQNERSQAQNKALAIKILQGKLLHALQAARKEKLDELRGGLIKPEWGHQIRSYVLHPYQLVKDHRTNHEEKDAKRVLAGAIDPFIEAWLRKKAEQPKEAHA